MKNYQIIKTENQVANLFQVFFDYVRHLVEIPESDQEHCKEIFEPIFVKKGTIIESEGTIHKYHNFIVSGHMRNFHHDENGNEVTTDINNGPRFFTSYYHFINQTVSNENLHCITDCELLRISKLNVEKASHIGLTSQEYTERVLHFHLESSKQRIIDLTTLSGKERYVKLMKTNPEIVKNVPLIYIASYLGLNPGSLSRIRQELS
ncbi:Crp/Fnr family transcriptional regulator [uncultured Tenacibaculum sp.]|uniref:Crp/Fnr family transcriptional regulator n=1 Tax=uncultured Tenacibaculum sp. TaxID=174713 RepID=UPI00260FACA3|nr:Crp/Fnr family transcriptional regulator [uncultured Tenacibaculum sp.]